MKKLINLQRYDDGNGNGQGGTVGGTSGATYSFEQAEEIANARADRAKQSALKSYFEQQGMTQDQINQAIADFKEKQKANTPDTSKIQGELDVANKKIAQYENEKILTSKGVKADDMDYVLFKVSQMVTDKKDFKTAADEFLKENTRFTGQTYRMSSGSQGGTPSGGSENKNDTINNMIRNAFGR